MEIIITFLRYFCYDIYLFFKKLKLTYFENCGQTMSCANYLLNNLKFSNILETIIWSFDLISGYNKKTFARPAWLKKGGIFILSQNFDGIAVDKNGEYFYSDLVMVSSTLEQLNENPNWVFLINPILDQHFNQFYLNFNNSYNTSGAKSIYIYESNRIIYTKTFVFPDGIF